MVSLEMKKQLHELIHFKQCFLTKLRNAPLQESLEDSHSMLHQIKQEVQEMSIEEQKLFSKADVLEQLFT